MLNKLAVALVSLVAALVLMWFWWTDPANYVALGAALTSLAVAVFWGVEHVMLTERVIKQMDHAARG